MEQVHEELYQGRRIQVFKRQAENLSGNGQHPDHVVQVDGLDLPVAGGLSVDALILEARQQIFADMVPENGAQLPNDVDRGE